MTAGELLAELQKRGIELMADGDLLCFRPKEVVSTDLLLAMRNKKQDLLEIIASKTTTGHGKCPGVHACRGCYEVRKGVYLHPPTPSEEWKTWLAKWQPKGMTLQ